MVELESERSGRAVAVVVAVDGVTAIVPTIPIAAASAIVRAAIAVVVVGPAVVVVVVASV